MKISPRRSSDNNKEEEKDEVDDYYSLPGSNHPSASYRRRRKRGDHISGEDDDFTMGSYHSYTSSNSTRKVNLVSPRPPRGDEVLEGDDDANSDGNEEDDYLGGVVWYSPMSDHDGRDSSSSPPRLLSGPSVVTGSSPPSHHHDDHHHRIAPMRWNRQPTETPDGTDRKNDRKSHSHQQSMSNEREMFSPDVSSSSTPTSSASSPVGSHARRMQHTLREGNAADFILVAQQPSSSSSSGVGTMKPPRQRNPAPPESFDRCGDTCLDEDKTSDRFSGGDTLIRYEAINEEREEFDMQGEGTGKQEDMDHNDKSDDEKKNRLPAAKKGDTKKGDQEEKVERKEPIPTTTATTSSSSSTTVLDSILSALRTDLDGSGDPQLQDQEDGDCRRGEQGEGPGENGERHMVADVVANSNNNNIDFNATKRSLAAAVMSLRRKEVALQQHTKELSQREVQLKEREESLEKLNSELVLALREHTDATKVTGEAALSLQKENDAVRSIVSQGLQEHSSIAEELIKEKAKLDQWRGRLMEINKKVTERETEMEELQSSLEKQAMALAAARDQLKLREDVLKTKHEEMLQESQLSIDRTEEQRKDMEEHEEELASRSDQLDQREQDLKKFEAGLVTRSTELENQEQKQQESAALLAVRCLEAESISKEAKRLNIVRIRLSQREAQLWRSSDDDHRASATTADGLSLIPAKTKTSSAIASALAELRADLEKAAVASATS